MATGSGASPVSMAIASPASEAWAMPSPKNAMRRSVATTPSDESRMPRNTPPTMARCMVGEESSSGRTDIRYSCVW